MRANMVPGALFPDYELTDHAGRRRKLSDLQGSDPMILLLSRGGYCPKDRRQAEGLVHLHREMEVGYCSSTSLTTPHSTRKHSSLQGFRVRRHRQPQENG
jgi:peroxiredoxin